MTKEYHSPYLLEIYVAPSTYTYNCCFSYT